MASQYQSAPQYSSSSSVATVESQSRGTLRSVPLMVAGQRIVIRTDQSEAYLFALANEINALLERLRQASPTSGLPALMALASIQLLDRALNAEHDVEEGNLKIERHIERLSGILRNLDNGVSING